MKKRIWKKTFALLLAVCLLAGALPLSASAASYTTKNNMQGSDFATGALAARLDVVFRSGISGCVSPALPAVGGALDNSKKYTVTYEKLKDTTWEGWQCMAYAYAAYSYLFGYKCGNASDSYYNKVIPEARAKKAVSYSQFQNWGVKCGAYMRTTANSDGSYNASKGHSIIILKYDSSGIYTLEGNYSSGKIGILYYTWNQFNSYTFTDKGRCVCAMTKPTESVYSSISYPSTPAPTPVGKTSKPSVSVNGQTVTASWTYSGSAEYIDVCLIQEPWGWYDIVQTKSTTGNSCTFYNVSPGYYQIFTIARPNLDKTQSEWTPFTVQATHTTHTWDSGKVTKPATETSTGIRTYTCTICGATKTETIAKLSHTTHAWDSGKVTKEATVVETGVKTYTCTMCGATKTETIPKLASATGKCGDSVTWNYNSGTGVLTISGTGDMYDFYSSERKNPWSEIGICFKEIRISSGVTSIGAEAFRQNSRLHDNPKALVSVTIPNTVKRIGYHAFDGNEELTSVAIPSSVTKIESGAFNMCTSLKKCEIPSSVTSLGSTVFYKAPLTGAVWENGLRYYCGWVIETETETAQLKYSVKKGTVGICGATFNYAGWLKSGKLEVSIPEGVKYIGESCFWDCYTMEKIEIPDSVVKLERAAFLWCGNLKEIKLSKNITSIEDRTFENCYVLTAIEIPKGVISIGNKAFCNCQALSSVTIPDTVTSIANDAFLSSSNVTIYCNSGSYAETYAKKCGIPYTVIGDAENPNEQGFTDVPSNAYYAKSVAWAVENGITSGTGKGKFSPNASCTRAQAVAFLWRAAGKPEPASTTAFSDVKSGAYYEKAVKWAVEKGVTSGTGGGKFSPDAICDRSQIVTFLWRAEGKPGTSNGSSFSDVKAGSFYETAVQWAVANGITSGTGNGKFSPTAKCDRSQIVTFLYRYMK